MSVRPIRPRASGVAVRRWLVLALGLGLACSSRTQRDTAGPARPTGGLEFPSLAVEWTPPMLTAGDVELLAEALARHPQVTLVLGPRLAGATWAERGVTMLAALSPATRVTGLRSAELTAMVSPASELLALRRDAAAEGRPRYAATLGLTTAAGTGPVVAVDDVAVDLARWQALASSSVGSCEPAMLALADGQEAALARLAPFLDHADAEIERVYRAKLREVVPGLGKQLSEGTGAQGDRGACVQGYAAHVQAYAGCVADARVSCPGTPRFVLVGGARVVAAPTRAAVGERCPALVGRDPAAELRGLADAAAAEVSATLDPGWTVLADRMGTLTEVHAALEDVCVPRRRRFTADDLADARARLARIGVALASDELRADGRWVAGGEALTVPGLGSTRVVRRYEAGPGSVNAVIVGEARALREFVLGRGLCRAGHAALPMGVAVGVAGQPAEFFGYFYEEELVCGGLQPLRE